MGVPATIADLVGQQDDLTTLASAVDATGLSDVLSGDGPLTVFAPDDDAFNALTVDDLVNDTELLAAILQYHVVEGELLASDLTDGQTIETLHGDELRVSVRNGTMRINGATVTTADVQADNGVAHIIDRALLENRTAMERLSITATTQTLATVISNTNLASAFADAETWTVFAPIDDALAEIDVSSFTQSELIEILQYHIIDSDKLWPSGDQVRSLEENGGELSLETLQGERITFRQEDGRIVLNGGQATLIPEGLNVYTDDFTNIAHLIDGVLLPEAYRPMLQAVSYDLTAQSNSGAIPNGVAGTATFWELNDAQTLVTLALADGATGTGVSHPAHIHTNSTSSGGNIAYYLTPISGSGGGGTSARVIGVPFDELTNFDGHITIHESVATLGTILSEGDIGSNAAGITQDGLVRPPAPRFTSYTLNTVANNGSVAPNGLSATATFIELTDTQTLARLDLNIDQATGANAVHPAHIHENTVAESGNIVYYLGPIDGSDTDPRSSKVIDASYASLVNFNGHINIHESPSTLGTILSEGNIGANAGGSNAFGNARTGHGY